MRLIPLLFVLSLPAFPQNGTLGSFTDSNDVGQPPISGSAHYDPVTGGYKITGSGTDIWGKADQFHYVWRSMSGNFAVSATARFLTEGIAHRKAVIMLRQSLDPDSPFVQLAIHADGTPAVQFRSTKGDTVNTIDFPNEGPATWNLKLERQGSTITVWLAKNGDPLRELGHTLNQLGSPILVGLGVSSHTQAATNTVLFSKVSVQELPSATKAPALGLFSSAADIGQPAIKGTTEFANGQYRMTAAGANMWGKRDQFQYVWREAPGDFTLTATVHFDGQGVEHRKAGLMVRHSTDPDAPYADVMMHGNGMAALQWRSRAGEDTNSFDLPVVSPGIYRLKLVRTGIKMYMYLAKEGLEPQKIANTEVTLRNPVLVGLALCSHDASASTTATFSDVSLVMGAPPLTH